METAILYYQSAVDADPQHIGANTICCSAMRETADFEGAITCLHRLLKQKPNDLDLRRQLNELSADHAIHRGKYAMGASRESVESAGTTIAENEDVMGRSLTEEEQIERRITKNPQDTANYLELAQWHLKQSNYAKAEECYTRAVLASENAPDMVERLLETQKKRLYAETLHLKNEYEKDPQEERKSIFLAVRDQYDTKNMELAWHRVQYCPEQAGYRYEYGLQHKKNGQVQEAIAELQLAKAERARLGDCLLALGQCFQMIRQNKLAMSHYQEAVAALEPGESKKKALYFAMKLALTLEDYAQAESYGHQLAAIDFSYRDLGQILDQITRR
jgi:tetratricopeptide (TPR) repeat protein